jgi:D-alanyl-D-alanine carboxypeptidase/D-alanyl-D-alanine-endopeptidase (penicillin-binding protein 4)
MRWLIAAAVLCLAAPVVARAADGDTSDALRRVVSQDDPVVERADSINGRTSRTVATPKWKRKIHNLVSGHSMGVSVRIDGDVLIERGARIKRVPASNEKLLLSMALYDNMSPSTRLTTRASALVVTDGTVEGDLWVLGGGDPTVMSSAKHAKAFSIKCTRLGKLAGKIRAAGITRITGGVRGAVHYFDHDWYAPGWKSNFPADYVALPSALSFNTNSVKGNHISDPEFRVARSLTKKLEKIGVKVDGAPSASAPPEGLNEIARAKSEPIRVLARYMNRQSSNFFAEMLGKRLGVKSYGVPGTIAKGARAIETWASGGGVVLQSNDASGLSYSNRVSARGMARLLDGADEEPWGDTLRKGLPKGNQGTLEDRLHGVPVRAKTGTLSNISTLSGWVYLKRMSAWAPFSILSAGMSKSQAVDIEDKIVRILTRSAR